jgi:hypothetical protein
MKLALQRGARLVTDGNRGGIADFQARPHWGMGFLFGENCGQFTLVDRK